MNRSLIKSTAQWAGLLALGATLSGCSAGYPTDNASPVLFTIALVNGGSPLKSDVSAAGVVISDSVDVSIGVRFKNPNVDTVPSIPNAVILDRYEVHYRRSDGKGVEGQDVPYAISGNITTTFDVKTSGTDPVVIDIVRAQAKLDPPLRNLQNGGGSIIVTMIADITLHGHTISGQTVTGKGSLQIDFADWADDTN